MKKTELYKIFIASPSDTKEEWVAARETIQRWNTVNSESLGATLSPIQWLTDASPEIAETDAQSIINKQILNDGDILIGIFWGRIGVPTKQHDSGTIEEIEEFIGQNKPVLLYFSSKEINPYQVDSGQFEKVKAVKEKYSQRGLIWSFQDVEDFKDKLFGHLTFHIRSLKQKNKSANKGVEKIKAQVKSDGRRSRSPNNMKTMREGLRDSFVKLEQTVKGDGVYLKTGFKDFDLLFGGLFPGGVFVIGGGHSVGKSMLIRNLAAQISIDFKVKGVYFSISEMVEDVCLRMVCSEARVDRRKMLSARLSTRDYPKLSIAVGPISEAPLSWVDDRDVTISSIVKLVSKLKQDNDIKVVFIDDFHMIGFPSGQAGTLDWQKAFVELKRLAVKLGVAIVIALPLVDFSKRDVPILGDLGKYKDVVDIADMVILLSRDEVLGKTHQLEPRLMVHVEKNKNGPKSLVYLGYDDEIGKVYNAENLGFEDF